MQDPKTLASAQTIAPLVSPKAQFAIGQHAAYLQCSDGRLKSEAGAALLGKTRELVTTRNWATVLKREALATKASG